MEMNFERQDLHDWASSLAKVKRGTHNYLLSVKVTKLVNLPKRARVSVTVYKLDKNSKEGETILVPGKILHSGKLSHKIKIAAVSYSERAKKEISTSGSSMISIDEALKAKGVRIIT
jgi:large subunit ribosomal protein L18e